MNTDEVFGAHIFALRQRLTWSQSRLATEAGISKSYVSQVENGHVPPPVDATVERLVLALSDAGANRDKLLHLARVGRYQWHLHKELPTEISQLLGFLLSNADKISTPTANSIIQLVEDATVDCRSSSS